MEEVAISLFESSIVGGAFVYLLWYITRNFKQALDDNTAKLGDISNTLKDMDARIAKLERSVE